MLHRYAILTTALLLTTLTPGVAPAQKAKAEATFREVRELLNLYRRNLTTGGDNERVRDELASHKDVPAIRSHCRRMFKANVVTDTTMDELSDWLCLNLDTTAAKVDAMKLSEVVKHLDKHAKAARK